MQDNQAEKFRNVINALYRIGPRNLSHYQNLTRAHVFLEMALRKVCPHTYLHEYEIRGRKFHNVIAEKKGTKRPDQILILGAHYDSHKNSPGCNDNGSGIALLLQLAEDFASLDSGITLRFVCFVNKEGSFTHTKYMGSRVYARYCREKNENIVGMICLETPGTYIDTKGKHQKEDFLTVISNRRSEELMRMVDVPLRRHVKVKSKVVPEFLRGSNSSDHWSFWKEKYPAIMLTNTESLRYRYYHTPEDTPEKINYDWPLKVYAGLYEVLTSLSETTGARASETISPF